jgi:hypothetical protein
VNIAKLPELLRTGEVPSARIDLSQCGCRESASISPLMAENSLEMAERHVGERHIAGQRRLLAWLEQIDPGKSESAKVARDILATFEKIQTLYVADRDRLKRALRPF